MSGTREGGLKAAKKNLASNPNFYREIGAKGGSAKGTKGGFAAEIPCRCHLYWFKEHLKRQCAARKGGRRSKRGKAVNV